MQANVKLGSILGIPIGLHTSWFLIFGLVTWSLALGYFPDEYPELPGAAYWLLGALTSILFFGSVLLHELGHSVLAQRNGIPVQRITLFIFGGVAQIGQEPRTPGAEFRIAIAGPLTSAGLAIVFGGLWLLDRAIPYLAAPSIWLARINLILAAFNLIPGFPLDGGRILRAVIWQVTRSFQTATQVATFSGQFVAFGFIGVGVFIILGGNLFNGLWLVFIGWFLQNAAAATYAQASLKEQLQGIKVGFIMTREYPRVSSQTSLRELIDEQILHTGQRYFLVADNGHLIGMLGLRDVAAVPQASWGSTTVEQVMVPWERLSRVGPATELMDALLVMDDRQVAQLPVVEGDQVLGVISREQVLHYIRTRSELKI
jgi:Zn-dependent protease/predicted transcriptional regulator